MVVFIWPLVDLSFSKNDHFSPPLDSLRSWVLSAHSEVLAYYIVEAVFSTQWKKILGSIYMASNGSLCSTFQFFSWKKISFLPLSIPYLVGFSVRAQRCLLYHWSSSFHTVEKKLVGSDLHTYMASNGGFWSLFGLIHFGEPFFIENQPAYTVV